MDRPKQPVMHMHEVPLELLETFTRAGEGYTSMQVASAGLAIAAIAWGYMGHSLQDLATSAGFLGHLVERGQRLRDKWEDKKRDAAAAERAAETERWMREAEGKSRG